MSAETIERREPTPEEKHAFFVGLLLGVSNHELQSTFASGRWGFADVVMKLYREWGIDPSAMLYSIEGWFDLVRKSKAWREREVAEAGQ